MFLIWSTFGTFRFFGEAGSAITEGVLDDPGQVLTNGAVALAIALLLFVGATGKIRADPALRLAAGRDGRPDARLRPDPRRDDGHRRGLHDRPLERPLPAGAEALVVVGGDRRADGHLRRHHRAGADDIKRVLAYSTVSQLGYMFLALGAGRLRGGRLPPDDARLLQGPALPRRRLGDPRLERRAGHAPAWAACARCMPWTTATFIVGWLAIIGFPGLSGLLQQGRDPDGHVRDRATRSALLRALRAGPDHRGADRLLHVPPGVHDVLRRSRAGSRPGRPPARPRWCRSTSRRWPGTATTRRRTRPAPPAGAGGAVGAGAPDAHGGHGGGRTSRPRPW